MRQRKRIWHRRLEQFLLDTDACSGERNRVMKWARTFGRFEDAYAEASHYELTFLVTALQNRGLLPHVAHVEGFSSFCWCSNADILRETWPARQVLAALRRRTSP